MSVIGATVSHSELGLCDGEEYTLTTRLIEAEAAFAQLEEPWSRLSTAARTRPFQDFGWISAWAQTIGRTEGRELRIATLWDGSHLVGILPMVRRRYLGVRMLEWAGARAAEYCDAIIHPNVDTRRALLKLWSAITSRADYDVIRLSQVRGDARIGALFQAAGIDPWVESQESTYRIPVCWHSGPDWLNQQTAHARKELRYDLRRLAKEGCEFYVWSAPDPYEPLLETVIEQKSAWLARQRRGTLYDHPLGSRFLRKCVAAMAAKGSLHLCGLRSARGFAACHLGFYQQGVLYGYMLTYDPAWARYSPGAALRASLIMWACDNGVAAIDLLRGADRFKLQYGPQPEPLQTFVIPRGLIGNICLLAYRRHVVGQRSSRSAR